MELASQLAAVAGVLLLLVSLLWLLRRGPGARLALGRRGSAIEVVETRTVTPQLSVAIVRVREREWTLAVHTAGVRVLDRGDAKRGPA